MRWEFHGLIVDGIWTDDQIGERWQLTFGPRPLTTQPATLTFHLALTPAVPAPPPSPPDFQQGELLAYYVAGQKVIARFPRYGQLQLDLAAGTTTGQIVAEALATYGVFEDLLAIGLSPHLRRRGMFLIHAFAATPPEVEAGVLLVGDIGAGKTTTGLALLHAGWKLLSNDSPILTPTAQVLAYPGLLSAYPNTLARFPELAALNTTPALSEKKLFAAEAVYPAVWREAAPLRAIFFPQIEPRADHALERLSAPDALRELLPHAIEQWDRAMIPTHLALLSQIAQNIPAYRLRLGPTTETIPAQLMQALQNP